MKYIQLTQGKQATVDDSLYDWLNQWKWYYKLRNDGVNGDAARTLNGRGGKNKTLRMQNLIMPPAPGCVTDHHNMLTLDNRIVNLREATRSKNGFNQRKHSNNTTGHKGISWHKRDQQYRVQIRIGKGNRIVKGFDEDKLEEAIKFRDEMYERYHGEFGRMI